MALKLLKRINWTGRVPGFADTVKDVWVCSVPNERKLLFGSGENETSALPLPEVANWVELSASGQKFAWQGAASGMVYEGLDERKKGYGQHSFLYIGEQLQIIEDDGEGGKGEEEYQRTSGGWRYVNEAGQVIPYGATYSGVDGAIKKPWERTEFADGLMIGQGPNDNDGIVVVLPGESVFRQITVGNAHNIHARRYGNDFVISAVFYGNNDGYTEFWAGTVADLASCKPLAAAVPQPSAPPPPVIIPTPEPEKLIMNFPENAKPIVDQFVQKFPVPTGGDVNDQCRRWCLMLAEQVKFSTADPNWGVKRADGGRPQSKDSITYNAGSAIWNFDMLTGVGTGSPTLVRWPEGVDITGQTFMPVNAINHLADQGTPSEPPPPSQQPPAQGKDFGPEIAELRQQIADLNAQLKSLVIPAPPDLSDVARKGDKVTVEATIELPLFGKRKAVAHGTIDR